MNKVVKGVLINAVVLCACGAIATGSYFGLKKLFEEEVEIVTVPDELKPFYSEGVQKYADFTDRLTSDVNSKYFLSAYAVLELNGETSFTYSLTTAPNYPSNYEKDIVQFSIVIKDNAVKDYHFKDIVSGHYYSESYVTDTEAFDDMTLDSADDYGKNLFANCSETYSGLQAAIKEALKDASKQDPIALIENSKAVSDEVLNLFADLNPKAEENIIDFTSGGYILAIKKVTLEDSSIAFYYKLTNRGANPEHDISEFEIGVQDLTVTRYNFLQILEGHYYSEGYVTNTKAFIGMTVDSSEDYGASLMAGCSDSYYSFAKAVLYALNDCQGRIEK